MSYGLLIRNDNATVLISSETVNPVFVGKAVLSQSIAPIPNYTTYWEYRYTVSNCPDLPLVFATCGDGAKQVTLGVESIGSDQWRIVIASTGSAPEVYVFRKYDAPMAAAGDDYGMEVYTSTGASCFSTRSTNKYLRLVYSGLMPNPQSFMEWRSSSWSGGWLLIPDQGSYSLVPGVGMTKPIMCFPYAGMAGLGVVKQSSSAYDQYVYLMGARYSGGTLTFMVDAYSAQRGLSSGTTDIYGNAPGFILMSDGAFYD
ncbi:MAG: hypothetical protein H6R10_693 [Rhodocyclaceae bacterium]|nr:hypothetical protein [Rhodocyclaceae bacterium]